MIPKGFRLNGGKFECSRLPKFVADAITFLDKQPPGELLSAPQLAAALGRSMSTLMQNVAVPALADYRQEVTVSGRHRNVYASKTTIRELRKKLNENQ